MASAEQYIGLDIDDLTPRQLKKAFKMLAMKSLMRHKRDPEDVEDDDEDEDKFNADNVNLAEEKRGDSRPPKVNADDLPEGIAEASKATATKKKTKQKG